MSALKFLDKNYYYHNILDSGPLRAADAFKVHAVANDGRFPFFILTESSVGYLLKLDFVNGASWGESERESLFYKLEQALKIEGGLQLFDYTYAFTFVRSPLKEGDIKKYDDQKNLIKDIRVKNLKTLARRLETQKIEVYLTITASPSESHVKSNVGWIDQFKMFFSEDYRYKMEASLLEDIILQFGDKIRQTVAVLTRMGIKTRVPKNEADLLRMARRAWRPNYKGVDDLRDGANNSSVNDNSLELSEDNFHTAASYLTAGLKDELYRYFWLADGCLNLLFTMEEPPDPNITYEALMTDRFLRLGMREGVSALPYFINFTLAFNSMTREDGDKKFRLRSALASAQASSSGRGYFRDKIAEKEAREMEEQHSSFVSGDSDMVNALIACQVQIPIEHLNRFFDLKESIDDRDKLRSIVQTIRNQLCDIGYANWRLEDRTFYNTWLGLMPGGIRINSRSIYMPRTYMSLRGALHFSPLFATVSPDQNEFNGANYFVTDEASLFTFEHFSKNNGNAANFAICGETGSGKSVVAQTLVTMTSNSDLNIMVLDFGGGANVGSWTKLCAIYGGVELRMGAPRPPRINPFELSDADALPNKRKKDQILYQLGIHKPTKEYYLELDAAYHYLKADDSEFSSDAQRKEELVKRMPLLSDLSFGDIMALLKINPGEGRPGEKATASLRTVLTLILANDVKQSGPVDNPWLSLFDVDDINEVISSLYENFNPEKEGRIGEWPTMSDFRREIERVHFKRIEDIKNSSPSEAIYKKQGIYNYATLYSKISNWCYGGLDDFLDGQTNVDIYRNEKITTKDGSVIEQKVPARFILADMASIKSERKLAIYMITINDFMSSILYNSKRKRGIIIRDEAWFFMKSALAEPYLDADYRLARKYGFSVITIAQQLQDFKSKTIRANTQNWIVCNLSSIEERSLGGQMFRLNGHEMALFEERRMGTKIDRDSITGEVLEAYSRVLIHNKSGKYFVKNKISKEELWITTTDSDESFVYNYYKETKFRGRPEIEIIRWLCTGEYKKDPELIKVLGTDRKMPSL